MSKKIIVFLVAMSLVLVPVGTVAAAGPGGSYRVRHYLHQPRDCSYHVISDSILQ